MDPDRHVINIPVYMYENAIEIGKANVNNQGVIHIQLHNVRMADALMDAMQNGDAYALEVDIRPPSKRMRNTDG